MRKNVTSDDIPDSWELSSISELGKVQGGSTPDTKTKEYWKGDIPWLTPSEVTESKLPFVSESDRKLTEEGLDSCSAKLLPEKSLLLTTRATIGEALINEVPMSTNQGFQNIIPNEKIDVLFLYYQVLASSDYLNELGSGSTFNEVSKSMLKKVDLSVPTLPEQRKIASIFYNVDRAIQKTEEIIEQTRRVKKGVMQDLFTEGYFDHKSYREKRIGPKRLNIPNSWNIETLGNISHKITDGTHQSPPTVEEGFPYITSENIREYGFDFDEMKYIAEEDHKQITSRCNPEKGDILYVKDGANTGIVQVNTLDFDFSLLSSVALIKPLRNKIDPFFLMHMLSWQGIKSTLLSQMSGTGIRRLTISKLKKSDVIFPPLKEQNAIAEVLNKYDTQVHNLKSYHSILCSVKRGLMQDLLTGEVRTHDKDIEVLDDIKEQNEDHVYGFRHES